MRRKNGWQKVGKMAGKIGGKMAGKLRENGGKIRKWISRNRGEGMAGKKRIKVVGKIRKGKMVGKIGGKV